jgi:iron complex transport system ATP-binding protein
MTGMPTVPVIQVRNLTLLREATTILSDVDWTVSPGEHWAILGRNGSGKTSLLNVLMSYLSATRGSVRVLGHEYGTTDWRELRKEIGIVSSAVPQMMPAGEPGLNVVYSGKDAMIGAWGAIDRVAVDRAEQLLAQVDCSHLERRPWSVLSQGERQRLMIARALMANPKLLILDEPCAGLDPPAREHFLRFIDALGRGANAPTLILVTHHVEEISNVFTHVLLLANGCVLASGTKQKVLTSETLSQAFGEPVTVREAEGRYSLSFQQSPGRVV